MFEHNVGRNFRTRSEFVNHNRGKVGMIRRLANRRYGLAESKHLTRAAFVRSFPMCHRSQNRQVVHPLRDTRQECRNMSAGQSGRNLLNRPANFRRCIGFHIKCVVM